MRENKVEVYLHLVWATWDRKPLISPAIQRSLYRVVELEAQRCGCIALAINGLPDHLHSLLRFPATLTIAELVQKMKGVSTRLINDKFCLNDRFRWQGCYGAFSVSRHEVDEVKRYIDEQKKWHDTNILRVDLEECYTADI